MPENNCVSDGKKLYCWNDETGKVDIYTRTSISVEKCPKDVLIQLMHLLKNQTDAQRIEAIQNQPMIGSAGRN